MRELSFLVDCFTSCKLQLQRKHFIISISVMDYHSNPNYGTVNQIDQHVIWIKLLREVNVIAIIPCRLSQNYWKPFNKFNKNGEIKLNISVELLQGHVFCQRFLEDFFSSKNRLHLANRWKSVIIFSYELIHLGQLGWFETNTILLGLSIDWIMLISTDLATRDAKIEKAL